MTTAQSSTVALYAELNKAIHIADYRQALKAANKILHSKEGKSDLEAKQCKAVCLIETNNFQEALKFIESVELEDDELAFEKAYSQYRLLKSKEALNTINAVKEPDLRLLELKAQVLYKLGSYKEALNLYKQLIKECSDDLEEERMTNLSAVHAALSMFEEEKTDMGFDVETHEQLYNKGCWLLGQHKFDEAEETLRRAEAVCKATFADDPDMTDEEKEAELSVIRVQLAYALQSQGKLERATTLYNQAIRSRPTDLALIAVASNNIVCINKDQNVFDSRKKIKAMTPAGIETKLVPSQLEKISYNRALVLMYGNQWDACRKLVKTLHQEYGSEVPCMVQTALLCREKNADLAIDYLEKFIEQYSDPDLPAKFDLTNVKLTLVQLLLSQGKIAKGCSILESLEEISFTPSMVSCLVALYQTQKENVEAVSRLMDKAIEWHKRKKSPTPLLKSLLWKYSQFLLKNNQPQAAAKTLDNLRRLDQNDVKVLAQLIYSYSQFDTEKAHQLSKDLPSLKELSVHVDVDELEKNTAKLAPRYVKKQKEKKEAPVSETLKANVVSEGSAPVVEIKKRKKKKKKNPVPKNFQADYVPDPERWIPLRERSYYKGRRKDKRKGGVGKGTQGTYAGAGEQYDISKRGGPSSSKAGTSAASPSSTPINSPKPGSSRNAPKGKKSVPRKKRR